MALDERLRSLQLMRSVCGIRLGDIDLSSRLLRIGEGDGLLRIGLCQAARRRRAIGRGLVELRLENGRIELDQ